MYRVRPKGINIKDNERDVPDGFLQESINLQWKDGSYRPIPERLEMISVNQPVLQDKIILHKVSDEDQVNVLAIGDDGKLIYYAKIIDGEFVAHTPEFINTFPNVTDIDSLSFTILNGLIYFMSVSQEFYYKLQYNETDDEYEVKNMYAWKNLIPYYPSTGVFSGTINKGSNSILTLTRAGIVLIRFTLVLNTGEEVLHSPIYPYNLYGLNKSTGILEPDELVTNIHTLINTNLEFLNPNILDEEISAINIYSSVASYKTLVGDDIVPVVNVRYPFTANDAKGETQRLAEEPFYLIKTIEKPGDSLTDQNILLYVGEIETSVDYPSHTYSKINIDTIAAGLAMPVDNFSYHKVFGKITSNNGRLIISNPKTVLSIGHMRALGVNKSTSRVGFHINTEDGDLEGVSYEIDTEVNERIVFGVKLIDARGILSYPDSRASYVGGNEFASGPVYLYKTRANRLHNLSCAFNFSSISDPSLLGGSSGPDFTFNVRPSVEITYSESDLQTSAPTPIIDPIFYNSNNRIQFSDIGEFSVWPAINSYRVGEGKVLFTGSNSIDPANTDYISPLFIGTTDGIYTANFDPTGANLIQSITKAAELPALSDKNVLIDQNLVYVSDKGLIVINNGRVSNITEEFFPEYGNGNFPDNNTIYPNYNALTDNLSGSDYKITDIVDYMKGALFAFDSRRNNIWCSNKDENFSLIYNLDTRQWTMSTYVFTEVIDFLSIFKVNGDDIYSRYLIRSKSNNSMDILSGEDETKEVYVHLLTRGIKMNNSDQYKKIERLISRGELYRSGSSGYFNFGLWGKQDINKNKINIPLIAYSDNSSKSFPNNIRQDIPVGRMKGKYKIITILQGGLILPNSSIDSFEIVAIPVESNILR
jgi:hypothetical protein